jgi:hypothetical protein
MAGDISRRTFDREKRYAGVFAQQGRVLSDADVNEQVDIGQYRTETEAIDVIGACGAPKLAAGFKLDLLAGGLDLSISPGRLYVDGLLCELEATAVPLSFPQGLTGNRAAVPSRFVNGRRFEIDQWVEMSAPGKPPMHTRITLVDTSAGVVLTFSDSIAAYRVAGAAVKRVTSYATQPDYPDPEFIGVSASPPLFNALKLDNGVWLAYVRAWQREINAIDDPHIRETALGGPDTATRLKNTWQVRLLKVVAPPGPLTCHTPFAEWDNETAASTGRLNARTKTSDATESVCLLPPQAGFRRLENQLYRVEIQNGGPPGTATFKWSRENASVETRISVNGHTITTDDLGKDEVLGFAGGQWAEIVDEESALKLLPNELIQIDTPNPGTREITTSANVAMFSGLSRLKLRRWDQSGPSATKTGLVTQPGWMELEDGVQVSFVGGNFRPGDHWLIPARTGTGDIEWPPFEVPNQNPIPQPPAGVELHYCRLAILTVGGGRITSIQDCRELFPPLTAISASDVDYDPGRCSSLAGLTNVQDAIDTLCHVTRGKCTYVAVPGQSVQAVFDRIPPGADAEVCFPVGTYDLEQPVVVSGKGRLKVSGAGQGTRISAARSEAALTFERCTSVSVSHLFARTGLTGSARTETDLRGTLTFIDCPVVEVDDVSLQCAAGTRRAATCLTVRNAAPGVRLTVPSARVEHCTLDVGHLQIGILLVDVARTHVEDNVIRVLDKLQGLRFDDLLRDRGFRLALRSRLLSNMVMGSTPPPGGVTNAKIEFGGHTVQFKTHPMLRAADWAALVEARPPAAGATPVQVLNHLKRLADVVLVDSQLRAVRPRFRAWFEATRAADIAVASQAIVVAGRVARDVRVLNNTIDGALQGVHIGVSHEVRPTDPAGGRVDRAGTIAVAGNTLEVPLSQDAVKRGRHAIFVGNCDSLTIENNFARLTPAPGSENVTAAAIVTYGFLGRKVVVRHNHIVRFSTGMEFVPRFPFPARGQVLWLLADNLFASVSQLIRFPDPPHNNPPLDQTGNKQG